MVFSLSPLRLVGLIIVGLYVLYIGLRFHHVALKLIFRPALVKHNGEGRTPTLEDSMIHEFETSFEGGKSVWQRMNEENIPGFSVAVVVDNKLAWSKGYGHIRTGSTFAVHPETLFQVASISKPVTAVGVYQMIEKNQDLTLDSNLLVDGSPLTYSIPTRSCLKLPSTFRLTLRNILRHRSRIIGRGRTYPLNNCGLEYFTSGGGGFRGYEKNLEVPNLREIILGKSTRTEVAVNSPKFEYTYDPANLTGDEIYYSGEGYLILQLMLEDAAPSSFASWMQSSVLDPMNMTRSHYTHDMYKTNSTWKKLYFDSNEVTSGHTTDGKIYWGGRFRYPEHAAAGLYTTAVDLSKLIVMLNNDGVYQGRRILQVESARTLRGGVGAGTGTSEKGNELYGHSGANAGYRAIFLGFPGLKTGVCVLSNSDSDEFPSEVASAVMTAYGW